MLTSVAFYLFLYDIYKITRETYCYFLENFKIIQGLGWLNELPIRRGFVPGWCIRLAAQVIKFTSCLPMVGGSLRVLRLPPPLKLVAMI